MVSSKLPQRIGAAANVGIVLTCVVLVLGALGLHPLTWFRSDEPQREPFRQARVGDLLSVPGVIWSGAEPTVLLVVGEQCELCVASLPAYSVIAQTAAGAGARVVAISPAPGDETLTFLQTGEVSVDAVAPIQEVSPALIRIPSVGLVDGDGVVTGLWPGRLAPDEVDQVLQTIRGDR